ncbi:MAG: MlaD family protein [Gemmatimonadetes bacterium]|nr:MlaD family protein [Gemmatimonadota bacterium]
MKEKPALAVGLVVLLAVVVVTLGGLWLSQHSFGDRNAVHTVRFSSVGDMRVGIPVSVRGVPVGHVEAIRLAPDGWVLADIRMDGTVTLPERPAVIAAPTSLFGEWGANIISLEHEPPDDPRIFVLLQSAEDPDGVMWPGAALPDIGQLTAQAGRIATDIGLLAERLGAAIDSSTADNIQTIVDDFVQIAGQLREFTVSQMESINAATSDVVASADMAALASRDLQALMARIDSATASGELETLMTAATGASGDLRHASANLRSLAAAAQANEQSFVNILVAADSVMTRLEGGRGSLGMAVTDSVLYVETLGAVRDMRQLIADIQENPRRYFSFSIF